MNIEMLNLQSLSIGYQWNWLNEWKNMNKTYQSHWILCFWLVISQHSYLLLFFPHNYRFPSMESNIEARSVSNNASRMDTTDYYGGNRLIVYPDNSKNYRSNGSLPRKFTSSSQSSFYSNYSHGAYDDI